MSTGTRSQWLVLCRPQGVVEVRIPKFTTLRADNLIFEQIWTLPKLTLTFSTSLIAGLEPVLVDSYDPPAPSLPQDPPRKPQELDVEQLIIAPLGESLPRPYLMVQSGCPRVFMLLILF